MCLKAYPRVRLDDGHFVARHISRWEHPFLRSLSKDMVRRASLNVRKEIGMNLFHRAGRGMAKWRSRAMLVDPHKTKINLAPASKPRRLPPWVYRNLQASGENEDEKL